jgi:hypothetical protein
MAARIEFEKEWLPKFKETKDKQNKSFTLETKKSSPVTSGTKSKALNTVKSEGLRNLLDNL